MVKSSSFFFFVLLLLGYNLFLSLLNQSIKLNLNFSLQHSRSFIGSLLGSLHIMMYIGYRPQCPNNIIESNLATPLEKVWLRPLHCLQKTIRIQILSRFSTFPLTEMCPWLIVCVIPQRRWRWGVDAYSPGPFSPPAWRGAPKIQHFIPRYPERLILRRAFYALRYHGISSTRIRSILYSLFQGVY